MNRTLVALTLSLAALAQLSGTGCSKERIVESTQYVKDVEYVQLPGDTVLQIQYIHDTIRVTDTVRSSDTVKTGSSGPNQSLAIAALQYFNDPMVFQFAKDTFGLNGGWVFYLSNYQLEAVAQSASVYDLHGYIDYWAPDWSGYYPLEFLWRLTYKSGDPAVPNSWQMSDPPGAVAGRGPGIHRIPKSSRPLATPR